jgi:predicted CoA-binding protein
MMNWQQNILHSGKQISNLLLSIRRIAVLGIKTERQAGQPAFYVPEYLAAAGFEIIPVPVYYPEVTEILGQKVYRRLSDIPVEVDLVNVFRRSEDIDQHVATIRQPSGWQRPAFRWCKIAASWSIIAALNDLPWLI